MGLSANLKLLSSIMFPELTRFDEQARHFAYPWDLHGTPGYNEVLPYGFCVLQGDVIRLRNDLDVYQVHIFDGNIGTYYTLRQDTRQGWHGLNIAFISDIHLKQGADGARDLNLLAEHLEGYLGRGATIDLLVNGGDTFDYGFFESQENLKALRRLSATATAAFSVFGNHDFYGDPGRFSSENAGKVAAFLSEAGMPVLSNQVHTITSSPSSTNYRFVFFKDIEAYRFREEGIERLTGYVDSLPPKMAEFKELIAQAVQVWKKESTLYPGYAAALADQLAALEIAYKEEGPVAIVTHNYDMAQYFLSEFHRIGSKNRYFHSQFPAIIMTGHTHATGLRLPVPFMDVSGLALLKQHGNYHMINKHVAGYNGWYVASYAGNSTVSVNNPGLEVDTKLGRMFTKNAGMVIVTWNGIPDMEGITPIGGYSQFALQGWRPQIKGIRPAV
ncbi:MAG: hypothetical protein HGA85_06695 [Nanoarchaeota archaeon]|nr:hypothetical protein [Nanoarchaeota archaeon]